MSLRTIVNENQSVVVVVAIVVIIAALFFTFSNFMGGGTAGSGDAWYYDTVTEKYFKASATEIPPIDSPDGNPAVRAHYYACGDCGSDADRFVGFYERYEPRVKELLEKAREAEGEGNEQMMMDAYAMESQGLQYSIDAKTWFGMQSPQTDQIFGQRLNCPDGSRAKYCRAK